MTMVKKVSVLLLLLGFFNYFACVCTYVCKKVYKRKLKNNFFDGIVASLNFFTCASEFCTVLYVIQMNYS